MRVGVQVSDEVVTLRSDPEVTREVVLSCGSEYLGFGHGR